MHKFKAILLLVIASTLASCSSFQEGQRVIASENDGEVIEGIVKQVECNRPTGFGAIELQVKRGKIIESTWYKVDSQELCSEEVQSALLGKSTRLAELGAANMISRDATISSVRVVDGFVVDVSTVETVKYSDYIKNVKGYETIDSNRKVMDWYFKHRRSN
jgi:hypothetical protein